MNPIAVTQCSPQPASWHYPLWSDLSNRFTGARNCFAAYLALASAEVVEGAKPGNLINLVNRRRLCGLNPYQLWRQYGTALLAGSGLQACELADHNDSLLLYLYRTELLQSILQERGVGIVLRRQGYEQPDRPEKVLDQLRRRLTPGSFPHEIGIFLGYPLKDVLAFMGEIRLAFACQGPWRIYGDPATSLELAHCYKECRWRMANRLRTTRTPARCLRARKILPQRQAGQC